MTYRFTPDMQLKLQYRVPREEDPDDDAVSHLFATQFTVRCWLHPHAPPGDSPA
jgi:hypothetical protein